MKSRAGDVIDGKYELLDVLGRGGMGCVYRATQLSMGRPVAVKLLPEHLSSEPEVVQRFLREAQVASGLAHQHSVAVYDCGTCASGELFLVMELLRGRTLREVLDEHGPIPQERVARLIGQVCMGLQHAHDANLMHRDLKPGNIFLMEMPGQVTDFVKVLDFGMARKVGGDGRLTQVGAVCGTPAYPAPEQVLACPLDHRCDVYALGVLIFELLTGQMPFRGASAIEIMLAHANADPPRLAGVWCGNHVTPAVERVVRKAMQKKPDDRYQTVMQLRKALIDAVREKRPSIHPRAQNQLRVVMPSTKPTRPERPAVPVAGAEVSGVEDTQVVAPAVRPDEMPTQSTPVPPLDECGPDFDHDDDEVLWSPSAYRRNKILVALALAAAVLTATGAVLARSLTDKDVVVAPAELNDSEPVAAPAEPRSGEPPASFSRRNIVKRVK